MALRACALRAPAAPPDLDSEPAPPVMGWGINSVHVLAHARTRTRAHTNTHTLTHTHTLPNRFFRSFVRLSLLPLYSVPASPPHPPLPPYPLSLRTPFPPPLPPFLSPPFSPPPLSLSIASSLPRPSLAPSLAPSLPRSLLPRSVPLALRSRPHQPRLGGGNDARARRKPPLCSGRGRAWPCVPAPCAPPPRPLIWTRSQRPL